MNGDFSIFGATAYSQFGFERSAQLFEVIGLPYKTADQGDLLATPVTAVYSYYEALFLRRKQIRFLRRNSAS